MFADADAALAPMRCHDAADAAGCLMLPRVCCRCCFSYADVSLYATPYSGQVATPLRYVAQSHGAAVYAMPLRRCVSMPPAITLLDAID